MLPISVKFHAFIPNSLGKPLLSYFKHLNQFKRLSNKQAFVSKINQLDRKGYTWLPEPYSTINYFATDDINMFHRYADHTVRLAIHVEIDSRKIGDYHFKEEIFKHHGHKRWGGLAHQHCGESHRAKVYIKRIPFYEDMPRESDKDVYVGVCEDYTKRADEDPLTTSIKNSKKYPYSGGGHDTTTIKVSASAGYPFTFEYTTPNIDFSLLMEFHKISNNRVNVTVRGQHNNFPAYELIIGRRTAYRYNPSDHGHTGPDIGNLTKSRRFQATEWVHGY